MEVVLGQITVKELQEMGVVTTKETVSILSDEATPGGVIVSLEEQSGNIKDIHQFSYPSLDALKKYISSRRDELNNRLTSLNHRREIANLLVVGGVTAAVTGLATYLLDNGSSPLFPLLVSATGGIGTFTGLVWGGKYRK